MEPLKWDLTLKRGDSFDEALRLYDEDPAFLFTLTGYTGLAQIRRTADDPEILAAFTVTLMNQADVPGGFVLSLTPAQAAALPAGTWKWDCEFSNAGRTDVDTWIEGDCVVTPDISRPAA